MALSAEGCSAGFVERLPVILQMNWRTIVTRESAHDPKRLLGRDTTVRRRHAIAVRRRPDIGCRSGAVRSGFGRVLFR
jgi:hypothetical protein